ncbi:uncharacterized protein LOC111707184 [Eurytemora carolleeae]|uniref:uncharacterized protein LOC111707184 n=1 Tax=Eurytemora carolleeae TaxID=1294199 RepID=UPI000C77AD35|nr:uncharacterized protein LOC111707184 [Eurytemora carolleeae]|eukprot:XP_023336004.1 uncharacterized protein LOC111707184 [Eurytemora affinis]
MGKNSVFKVPHEIAALLKLPDPLKYTFHSFRRTSATRAADAWATTEQLVDFFGWKNASMSQEYITSSRPAILGMANRLCVTGVNNTTKPKIDDTDKKVSSIGGNGETLPEILIRTQLLQVDSNIFDEMEEDEELFQQAGVPTHTIFKDKATSQHGILKATIKQTTFALPTANGTNINLKVIVINNMTGNINL